MVLSDLPDLRVWYHNGFALLSTGGRFRYFLSNSSFTSLIPSLITSVREIQSRFAHSFNKSISSPLMRICKLLSRLLAPLIGRPVLGDMFSPHFCHYLILTSIVAKVKCFFKNCSARCDCLINLGAPPNVGQGLCPCLIHQPCPCLTSFRSLPHSDSILSPYGDRQG